MFSLPHPVVVGNGATQKDHETVVKALKALLDRIVKSNSDKESTDDQKNRMRCENDRLTARLGREETNLETVKRENDKLKAKIQSMKSECHSRITKLTSERDDWRKQVQLLSQREAKFKSEVQKRDKEISSIKDRLAQEMSGDSGASGASKRGEKPAVPRQALVEMAAPLAPPPGRGRPVWKRPDQGESEFDMLIKRTYEDRMKDLVSENHEMRSAMRDLSFKVNDALLSKQGGDVDALEDGVFELPYELGQGAIESDFTTKVDALDCHSEQVQAAADDGSLNEREELAECRRIIREQQKLLNEAVDVGAS